MTAATRSGGAADVTGEDESYFVSMTDMLVGMLFVFIIILMAFALNLKSQETELAKTTDRLTEAQATRAQMLRDIRNTLLDRGVDVFIDERNGVLRFSPPTTTPISVACPPSKGGRLEAVYIEGHTDDIPFTSAPRTELRATGTYRPLARLPTTSIYCALHLSSRLWKTTAMMASAPGRS